MEIKRNAAKVVIHVILILFSITMLVPFVWMILTAFKSVTEATSVDPLTEKGNRTYNANDVVDFWKAMPKVTLNVN